jgi:hypothetical protein
MRSLLQLLLLAWIIWLMFRILKSPRRRPQDTALGRKKVDSTVVDKKDTDNSTDENQL